MDTSSSIKMTTLAIQNLFLYVEEENLAALKLHLDRFKEVDGRSDNGQTPLMVAAEQGSLEVVQELLRRGANVNLDDVDCWSALLSSSKEGHVEVVKELLENSAYIEHRDMGGWTALTWAAYKGRVEVTKLLLEHGANPNTTGQQYSVYPIIWAAGRGHADIVKVLLLQGAKVNCSDKYGTTPLIWASRKGHFDCVMHLLENGADVDQEGANSMTALIVAVRGGYAAVVKELLKRSPNVNMTDKDGNTALMIAAKEGFTAIVQDLLDAGTYVNMPDRGGDTVLIGAVRGGHVEIVRALLHKYADIDIRGQENKTSLYWAVEKGNASMVRDILQCNPDTESCTKDGDTALLRATKMRCVEVVELLLDKGAKVSAVDKKGDTPLHIAIRGRSRRLAELLLRNPKDGRLLYRPNKAGETPYNIDCSHQKSILTQIFGARHLSPSETDGDMLGYDLYSSALADLLSEPSTRPPLCVGLYAQWGSGKSFLLKKLEDEMKTFAGQQVAPLFRFSWLLVSLSLLLCGVVGVGLGFAVDLRLAVAVSLSLLLLLYAFCVLVYFGGRREGERWTWAWLLSTRLARQVLYLELLLRLMFVIPPELPEQSGRALPVRFLFTDYNRLSAGGGETSLAEMIATLSDACEREFGFLATRLFRVLRTEDTQAGSRKWKQTCCVPSFLVFGVVLVCLLTGLALLAVFGLEGRSQPVSGVLVAVGGVVGVALLLNLRTWWRMTDSLLNSQRKRLHGAASRMHKLKSEGFMKVLQAEVQLMALMTRTLDVFSQHQTRLTVVIDGLDSCEQDKVLQMLDTVRVLFSKGPFISIFASDPHILTRAITQQLSVSLRDAHISGLDYLRTVVHLPVFLNSRGLAGARRRPDATAGGGAADGWHEELDRKLSQHSLGELTKFGSKTTLNRRDPSRRRASPRPASRQLSVDVSRLLVSEAWLSAVGPQALRRLLNIVSVTGRLLRANQIAFSWDRLAAWIHLTETWPYRTSWILLFLEETDVPEHATLKSVYERVSRSVPTTKDVEPLLEIDADARGLEVFLSSRTSVLTAGDVRTFLPCTVNLDPKLRDLIADVRAARDQMNVGVAPCPPAPLQEAPPRPVSMYSQVSACSPSASFGQFIPPLGGGVSPTPHSSYYSGLAGPQHPFYNRPYFPHHLYQPPRPLMASTCPSHLHPRAPPTGWDATAGPASVASVAPPLLLSAMTTEAVCERVQQIDGIDQSVAAQYGATIRKANVNGRVLSQCDIDDLKREMNMSFGDWQLFRATVLDLRLLESQVLQEEAASEQGSVGGGASEVGRRAPAPMYSFNMSFEELSTLGGLEDAPRTGWMGGAHRTVSMSSLTSQASSNDIARLTERQQDEYRSAYQEYAAQMSQVETGGGERPVQPTPGQFMTAPPEDQSRDGGEPDGRKSFAKRSGKPAPDSADSASGADALDPITEEDEKGDHGAARAPPPRQALFPAAAAPEPEAGGGGLGLGLGGGGLRYQKLTSDDEESEESDNAPLLKDATPPGARRPAAGSLALKGKDFLSDATLDKKDSSDSGVRSNESSPDRSLQDEEAELSRPERDDLIELDEDHAKRRLPRSLGGPREAAPARMSVGSEDGWPAAFNLNRTASSVALHNHANNRPRPPEGGPASSADPASSSGDVILSPSSASSARPGPDNENVRVVHLKRGLRPGDPPEVCSMSSDTVTFGEERESIL